MEFPEQRGNQHGLIARGDDNPRAAGQLHLQGRPGRPRIRRVDFGRNDRQYRWQCLRAGRWSTSVLLDP